MRFWPIFAAKLNYKKTFRIVEDTPIASKVWKDKNWTNCFEKFAIWLQFLLLASTLKNKPHCNFVQRRVFHKVEHKFEIFDNLKKIQCFDIRRFKHWHFDLQIRPFHQLQCTMHYQLRFQTRVPSSNQRSNQKDKRIRRQEISIFNISKITVAKELDTSSR